jgi:hypothetical protein
MRNCLLLLACAMTSFGVGCSEASYVEDQGQEELRALRPAEVRGQIAYGETKTDTFNAGPSGYSAYAFNGSAGDHVDLWVRSSMGGNAMAWLLRDNFRTLARNDDASPGVFDAHIRVKLPSSGRFYVALRDAAGRNATFSVALRRIEDSDGGVPNDAAAVGSGDSGRKPRVGFRYSGRFQPGGGLIESAAQVCAASNYWGDSCGRCIAGPAAPGVALVSGPNALTPTIISDCSVVPTSPDGAVKGVDYCCETPFIKTAASIVAPISCDAVCASAGLLCTAKAPVYDGFGGSVVPGSATLEFRGVGAATKWTYADCSSVPPLAVQIRGKTAALSDYTCECVDPLSTLPPLGETFARAERGSTRRDAKSRQTGIGS